MEGYHDGVVTADLAAGATAAAAADAAADASPPAGPNPDERGPIQTLLDEAWGVAVGNDDGELATYIPELARVDPGTFGLAVATLDGHVYESGRLEEFTIQSVSKPFVYALALAQYGVDAMLSKIGVEPTGNAFNTISVDLQGRPFNPMVNAGAIVTSSVVAGPDADGFDAILKGLSAFAGRPLAVDERVYQSESATGDRNRAIAFLLRSVGALEVDVEAALAAYFRQCSVLVTARDLAVMSATLATGGVNPLTGDVVVPPAAVSHALTVMTTCGMYDFAGEWLYRVGLPAKSGVSGGIAAVHPGRLGFGAHSPLLDARGNSVRGVAAFEQLSQRLDLHLFALSAELPRAHVILRGDAVRSMRVRRDAERAVLDEAGGRIVVHALTGTPDAATIERVARAVTTGEQADWHVFDLHRVRHVEPAAVRIATMLVEQLRVEGAHVVVVPPAGRANRLAVAPLGAAADKEVAQLDDALRWCEDELLRGGGLAAESADALVPLAEQDLLAGLQPDTIAVIEATTTTRVFAAGATIFSAGQPADGLYFIGAGQVSAVLERAGSRRRLRTMGAGSSFGELALVEGGTRSATIVADDATLCYVLTVDAFEKLLGDDPAAAVELCRAVAASLATRLRAATIEIQALERRI